MKTSFFMKFLFLSLFVVFCSYYINSQVYINEASNANATTLFDFQGDDPDWIEIYNASTESISLKNYALSDKFSEPQKWIFPDVNLAANSFMTIFASGKNYFDLINHYETAVYPTNNWKYLIPDVNTASTWKNPDFNDNSWLNAPLGIGYGDGDDATNIGPFAYSAYVRTSFNIADTSKILKTILDLDFDDGFVAYLNGIEIARSGLTGNPPNWDELSADHEALIYQSLYPEKYILDEVLFQSALKNGTNVLAIEVHNASFTSSDLSLIPYLSFGFADATTYYGGDVHEWFNVQNNNVFHTNFTIKGEGESIYLSDTLGQIIDSMYVPDLDADMSFGRQNDGGNSSFIFPIPSPGQSNNVSQAYIGKELDPTILFNGGFYTEEITVKVTNNSISNGELRFTLNGQNPTINSDIFPDSILLNANSVLKVICFPTQTTYLQSNTVTESYFFLEDFTLPVLSISTDDVNLYGPTGIFDNNQTDWKKPCFVEYFDADGLKKFDTRASIKPDGGAGGSRTNPQHSVTIEPSNDVYGEGKPILYPLIPEKSFINEYHSFYLRNGSNLWNQYPQKDATIMRIMSESNVGSQAYSPVVVYLNGEYFGVYELREKTKAEYFEGNYGNDPDSLDLLSVSYFYAPSVLRISQGSDTGFYNMRDFVTSYPPANSDYFDKCHEKIDLYSFADYISAENWFANFDWIYNNMKVYRTRTKGNRWRFNLQDMEIGLGIWGNFDSNLFDYLRTQNLPNPYTEIFNGLMANNDFHDYFINRYADLMNTTFQEDYYKPITKSMYNELLPEMPRQFERWTGDVAGGMATFENNLIWLLYQFNNRNGYVRDQIVAEYNLTKKVDVTLDVLPKGAGYIKISTVIPKTLPWTGVYFDGVPVEITAVPNAGYEFISWQANNEIPSDELLDAGIKLNINSNDTFVALFQGDSSALNLTISEINYNSDASINGGNWIELHNYGSTDLAIGEWKLKSKIFYENYVFPINTKIPANGYLVVCEDTNLFKQVNPTITNFIGSTSFGFSNSSDSIQLYNQYKELKIVAVYQDSLPFPECADGWGRTLEHKSDSLSLLLGESWFCGCINGSPGKAYSACEEKVYFSEINYNSTNTPYYAGDWVEIKNNSNSDLSLNGFIFKDAKNGNSFTLPNVTIPANGYWVLTGDDAAFLKQHPTVVNKSGFFDFGLASNSEALRLYDANGILATSLIYKNSNPWTSLPSTSNYTLEYNDSNTYRNPFEASSWFAGCLGGSPGKAFSPCLFLDKDENLALYPNPTTGNLWIVFDNSDSDSDEFIISIFDLEGRIISTEKIVSNEAIYGKEFDLSYLANGMYFVRIQKGNEKIQKAFVKD